MKMNNKKYNKKKRLILVVLGLVANMWLLYSCKPTLSPADDNEFPNTTITNIPVPNDTLFPLVQIVWDGEDNDGYIVGCEYRYTTHHLTLDDSVEFDWKFSKEQILNIIFESSDKMNKQHLFIRAKDNNGAVDPTPSELTLYTPQTIVPVTSILIPKDGSEFFYLNQTTDWWQGVPLLFSAYDGDGEIVEYGWSIDGQDWTWTQDTMLFLTPDSFDEPLAGKHTIRVTAIDNTNLFDPEGTEITVTLVKPDWSKDILIVDETDETAFPNTINDSDVDVDSIYNDIFNPDSSWDLLTNGMPPRSVLGQYKLIVWHADNPTSFGPHFLPDYAEDIKDYLDVGGNIIISGWGMIKSFAYQQGFPIDFTEGSFVHDYLHINSANESPFFPGDFTGAIGVEGFSSVDVDGERLWAFPYVKKLSSINVASELGGFTEPIYIYKGADANFAGETCGIRYIGTDFNVISLGFPIFFLKEQDRKTIAQELLQGIKYQ